MFLRIERPSMNTSLSTAPVELVELVSPRTNGASYTSIEHLFAALSREGGVSLEIGGDATARRFYVRVAGPRAQGLLQGQLSAAYPQTRARAASIDPALRRSGEQIAVSRLELREPEYLPLRIPRDIDIASDRAPQADPLLGVLAALGAMPAGWRALAQLVLQPAPRNWARRHLRRTLEHALEPVRARSARSHRLRIELRLGRSGPGSGVPGSRRGAAAAVGDLPGQWLVAVGSGDRTGGDRFGRAVRPVDPGV